MSEKPVHSRLRRLVDWINLTGAKKVHSLIDKVYKRKNLEMAWEKVKANRGSGGVDGQNLEVFEAQLDQQLDRLQRELKEDTYQPLPDNNPSRRGTNLASIECLAYPRSMIACDQQALLTFVLPSFVASLSCLVLPLERAAAGLPKAELSARCSPTCM
jgi:RNA-directed DNA polymerase